MTKNTQVLNANATKFKVLSHASEKEELGGARAEQEVSQGLGTFEVWARYNTRVELTKEMIQ